MRKILLSATILALLAIPMMVVAASEPASPLLTDRLPICHSGNGTNWAGPIRPDQDGYRGHFDNMGNGRHEFDFFVDDQNPCPPAEPTPVPITTQISCEGWRVWQGETKLDEGFWTLPFELEIAASNFYDGLIREPERCLQEPPPTATPQPITLENSCAGWRLKQGGQTIDGAAWEDPYSLEVAASQYVDYLINEPRECLKERGDATLRIGGRCTEDGDSQEIGYVFDDGDFDGARLIITREDGVEVANEGEGSGFFPARPATYGWKIMWSDGQNRVQLDAGRFVVEKCDLPEATPTPKPGGNGDDDPDEHPDTAGEIDSALAVVTALSGLALAGIGGSILFMKRRASR